MSVKTFWRQTPDGDWEFMGAFPPDFEPDPDSPQASGSAILFEGLDVISCLKAMNKRTILSGLPSSIKKHLMTERVNEIGFDQVEGYLK